VIGGRPHFIAMEEKKPKSGARMLRRYGPVRPMGWTPASLWDAEPPAAVPLHQLPIELFELNVEDGAIKQLVVVVMEDSLRGRILAPDRLYIQSKRTDVEDHLTARLILKSRRPLLEANEPFPPVAAEIAVRQLVDEAILCMGVLTSVPWHNRPVFWLHRAETVQRHDRLFHTKVSAPAANEVVCVFVGGPNMLLRLPDLSWGEWMLPKEPVLRISPGPNGLWVGLVKTQAHIWLAVHRLKPRVEEEAESKMIGGAEARKEKKKVWKRLQEAGSADAKVFDLSCTPDVQGLVCLQEPEDKLPRLVVCEGEAKASISFAQLPGWNQGFATVSVRLSGEWLHVLDNSEQGMSWKFTRSLQRTVQPCPEPWRWRLCKPLEGGSWCTDGATIVACFAEDDVQRITLADGHPLTQKDQFSKHDAGPETKWVAGSPGKLWGLKDSYVLQCFGIDEGRTLWTTPIPNCRHAIQFFLPF